MAITTCVPYTAIVDLINGVHASGDTYKMALYLATATLDRSSVVYTASGETTGTGYTAGGKTLSGFFCGSDAGSSIGYIDFSDVVWNAATFSAAGCIIYNASKSNKILSIHSFGATYSVVADDFLVTIPEAGFFGAVEITSS